MALPKMDVNPFRHWYFAAGVTTGAADAIALEPYQDAVMGDTRRMMGFEPLDTTGDGDFTSARDFFAVIDSGPGAAMLFNGAATEKIFAQGVPDTYFDENARLKSPDRLSPSEVDGYSTALQSYLFAKGSRHWATILIGSTKMAPVSR